MIQNQLVSIIVLSYKNLDYIYQTLDSILIQDYPNIELILGDDGTVDFDNQKYINYIKNANKGNITNVIVYSNEMNQGTVKNINRAIKASSGQLIKLIAADDVLYDSTVIAKFVNYFNNSNSLIVVTRVEVCNENLSKINNPNLFKRLNSLQSENQFGEFCKGALIPAPGVCFSKDLFNKYGLFDEKYVLTEDWSMWLKLTRNGCRIDFLDIVSVKYRTEVGVSFQPNKIYIEDIKKIYENEILPYKDLISKSDYRKYTFKYLRAYKYPEYNAIGKILFIFKYIDLIIYNKLLK